MLSKRIKSTLTFFGISLVFLAVLAGLTMLLYLKGLPYAVSHPKVINYVKNITQKAYYVDLDIENPKLKTELSPNINFSVDKITLSSNKNKVLDLKDLDVNLSFAEIFDKNIVLNKATLGYFYTDVNKVLDLPFLKQEQEKPQQKYDWNFDVFRSVVALDKAEIIYMPDKKTTVFIDSTGVKIDENPDKKHINYNIKAEITKDKTLKLIECRHPVVEQVMKDKYIPNDIVMDKTTNILLITGPNMAGKSTYMRQNGLIAILAQIGSWVPADYARIGVIDKIFTRVGASDDLTLGQSTFMVEMIETACILNSATDRSFVLLDEIGRGTSTYDGVAIAWSVAEYIATKIKARCIFATHYHELNVMTQTYPQIKNYRITISEENGEIEFLRKVVQGGASKSYGIQVAKMAGLPSAVIKRSQDLMTRMQKDNAQNLATRKRTTDVPTVEVPQLNLFN